MEVIDFLLPGLLSMLALPMIIVGDPCQNYINIGNPRRSVAYETKEGDVTLCDYYVTKITGAWYRFDQYTGDKMPEACVPLRRCGTVSPIWMNGQHPTVAGQVINATACATYGFGSDCCDWSAPMKVKLCASDAGTNGGFYVYQLPRPGGCSMAYCAGGKAPCATNEVWNPDTQSCNDSQLHTSKQTRISQFTTDKGMTSAPTQYAKQSSTTLIVTAGREVTSPESSKPSLPAFFTTTKARTSSVWRLPTHDPSVHTSVFIIGTAVVSAGVGAGCALTIVYCFCRRFSGKRQIATERPPNYFTTIKFYGESDQGVSHEKMHFPTTPVPLFDAKAAPQTDAKWDNSYA